ncbi:MAG: GldG family protein [Spirochaetaceae bacterium]|jgi:hypothetical protein|nr:GldG family protein [Spirochaetaceae bacterium]
MLNRISSSLRTRYVKYGGFAAVIAIGAIAAAILLNLIVQMISPQFDLSPNKVFSLSEQTLRVIEAVKEPAAIYGIWEPGGEEIRAKEIAERYAAKNRLIRFEAADPDLNPGLMKRFDRNGKGIPKGSLVVEGAKGFKVITPMDMYDVYYNQQQAPQVTGIAIEKRITAALLYAGAGETPAVYEITGHQEAPLAVQDALERENYALRQASLMQTPIPENAAGVILNNPKTPFAPAEAERLRDYLEGGGRLLALLDYRSGAAESLNDVLSGYGLRFDYGVVAELDPNYRFGGGSLFEFLPAMQAQDIVNPLIENKTPVFMPLSMGVSVSDIRRRTVKAVPFLASSDKSFLRTDLNSSAQEQLPADIPGPITLGIAAVDPEYPEDGKQTRIVLVGNAMFAELTAQIPGNLDFFMNALAWITDRPEVLSVGSRSTFMMPMSMNQLTALIIGLVFVVLIPLICFVLGLITWLRRRHL